MAGEATIGLGGGIGTTAGIMAGGTGMGGAADTAGMVADGMAVDGTVIIDSESRCCRGSALPNHRVIKAISPNASRMAKQLSKTWQKEPGRRSASASRPT
jgi:hypothetical protein